MPLPFFSPRIYQIERPLREITDDPQHAADLGKEFSEASALGFDHVLLDDDGAHVASALAATQAHDLKVLLRLSLDQPDLRSDILARHSEWRSPNPHDTDFSDPLPDPRRPNSQGKLPGLRFEDATLTAAITAWWTGRLSKLANEGVAGFLIPVDGPAPAGFFSQIIGAVKAEVGSCRFIAWTPGASANRTAQLSACGFDAAVSSSAWWDFQSSWLATETGRLQAFGAVISTTSVPGQRAAVTNDLLAAGIDHARRERALWLAAFTGDGLIVSREFLADLALTGNRREPGSAAGLNDPNLFRLAISMCGGAATARSWQLLSAPGAAVAIIHATGGHAVRGTAGNDDTHPKSLVMATNRTGHAVTLDLASVLARYDGLAIEHSANGPGDGPGANFSENALHFDPATTYVYTVKHQRAAATGARDGKRAVEAAAKMPRIAIEDISPCVDGGRFVVKRSVGEQLVVEADIFGEGHDRLAAALLWRTIDEETWREVPMAMVVNDRWRAAFALGRVGRYQFQVEAWIDVFGAYRNEIDKKSADGQNVSLELREGGLLLEAALARAESEDRKHLATSLKRAIKVLDDTKDNAGRVALLLSPETHTLMQQADARAFKVRSLALQVDSERRAAGFSSWYELFPRSMGPDTHTHGTFLDVTKRLPAIRAMGFDTLYFTPIHPIGVKHRKGRNNTLDAGPDDVGSPYAIGSADGGHDAVHPELGTLEDFRTLRRAAADHGLELALDFAIQCSPDHPWLKSHPDWFTWRPDGTIRYAENPPKKYQDIVNVDFYAGGAVPKLWLALRDVVMFWVNEGVKVFRVDNPHTKPMPFWEWLIADVRGRDASVIFLAEAFTRPKPMYRLAKVGFSQSYSYFTWRHTKQEFTDYLTELSQEAPKDFFRPHFFVNTPDINPYFLQRSGRAGFVLRAALAATLSGLWGIYSGFELCEAAPVPGKEEYLDSEKYELRQRDWEQPGSIIREVTLLNQIRRANPALQTHLGVQFCPSTGDDVLCFIKTSGGDADQSGALAERNIVFTAINLDPHHAHECSVELPLQDWNLPEGAAIQVEDLVHGNTFTLHGRHHRLRLDPADLAFTIWRLRLEGVL